MESQIIRAEEGGHEKGVVIFDMSGFSIFRNDLRMIQQLVNINQNMYPERLSLAVLVGVPSAFMAVWTIIRPWLDADTAKKVHLFGMSPQQVAAGKELLRGIIDETALQQKYGGTRIDEYSIPTAKPIKGNDYPELQGPPPVSVLPVDTPPVDINPVPTEVPSEKYVDINPVPTEVPSEKYVLSYFWRHFLAAFLLGLLVFLLR